MGERSRRSVEEIEREIEARRIDLIDNVHALRVRVKQELSWRHHVRENPLAFVGAALLAGFLLGWR
jgi:hypothetical protein